MMNINPDKKINGRFRYITPTREKQVVTETGALFSSIPNTSIDTVLLVQLTIPDEARIIELLQGDELFLNTVMLHNSSSADISIAIASTKPIVAPGEDIHFILESGQHIEFSYILVNGILSILSSKIF